MNSDTNYRKLVHILTDTLGIDERQITDELSPEDVETWDSFNALVIASELETTFDLKFTVEEVTDVKNVGDMKKVLRSHDIKI